MISGDSSLCEKVSYFAKEGAKTGVKAGFLTTAIITAIAYGLDNPQFVKEFGIPGYVGTFAFMEAFAVSATLLVEVSAHFGGKAKDRLVEYIHNIYS